MTDNEADSLRVLPELVGHFAVLNEQKRLIRRDKRIGERHRVADNVIAADIVEPHDLVKLAADIKLRSLFVHDRAQARKLGCRGFAGILFRIQKKNRMRRKHRPVTPYLFRKILIRADLHMLSGKEPCNFSSLLFVYTPAIEAEGFTVPHCFAEKFVQCRHTRLSHALLDNAASLQLMLCLDEEPAIHPQVRLVFCNDKR